MRFYGLVLVAVLLALGGCATPREDVVVLLPGKDGKVGKVLVQNPKGETVLDSAYAEARTSDNGVKRDTANQAEVTQIFGTTLAAMPPRQPVTVPRSFSNTALLQPLAPCAKGNAPAPAAKAPASSCRM